MLYEIIKQKHTHAMKSRDPLLKSAYGNVIAKAMVEKRAVTTNCHLRTA